jgi:hypothetical protein
MLDRLVVYHSDDVDRLSLEHSAVGRYSLPVDAGSDTIILGDHIFDPHFESRHGAARDLHDVRKAARSANLAFTEPLVIDIVRRDELINPGNVTRPKGLHHFQHHSLRWHPRMMSHSPGLVLAAPIRRSGTQSMLRRVAHCRMAGRAGDWSWLLVVLVVVAVAQRRLGPSSSAMTSTTDRGAAVLSRPARCGSDPEPRPGCPSTATRRHARPAREVRASLEPWGDEQRVRELDEQLRPLLPGQPKLGRD